MLFSRSPWYLCNHTFCGKSPKAGIRLCSHVAPRTPTSESTSTGTSEAARSLEMKVDEFGRPAAAVCFCFLSVLHTHTHTHIQPPMPDSAIFLTTCSPSKGVFSSGAPTQEGCGSVGAGGHGDAQRLARSLMGIG